MAKYRKRPVVIEAVQVSIDNTDEVGDFFGHTKGDRKFGWHTTPQPHWAIVTLEGTMSARVGDWIIRGVAGEFYPCKPDIFEETYEAVE